MLKEVDDDPTLKRKKKDSIWLMALTILLHFF